MRVTDLWDCQLERCPIWVPRYEPCGVLDSRADVTEAGTAISGRRKVVVVFEICN